MLFHKVSDTGIGKLQLFYFSQSFSIFRVHIEYARLHLAHGQRRVEGLQAGADDFVESWYMSRGRSNLEIENYKAAIEAFEKVVERDPGNREAMRSLGIAYEKQGLKDKAVEQFDRYLARWDDDADIAFAQARALEWSRYAYREKDMLKYYRMGLKRKNDPAMRLRYATHLARHKETSQEAVAQYDKVLGYLETATQEGATAAIGGSARPGPGFFVQPTVFTGVTNHMTIAREEVFGPVAAVIKFKDEADAINRANRIVARNDLSDLSPQVFEMAVDGPFADLKIILVKFVEQLCPRKDPPRF